MDTPAAEEAASAVQAQITSELDGLTWLVVLDDEGKAEVESYLKDMVARHVECDPDEVEFINPRWSVGEFTADRVTFPLKRIHISFGV